MKPSTNIIVFASLVFAQVFPAGCAEQKEQTEYVAPKYKAFRVEPETRIVFFEDTAHLDPWQTSTLSIEVGGKLQSWLYAEGDVVSGERRLIELDERELVWNLESASAAYESSVKEREYAERTLERLNERIAAGDSSVSEDHLDAANTQVARAKSMEASAKVLMERATKALEDAKLIAPEGWRLVARLREENEWLTPGTPVATVIDDLTLKAIVTVPSRIVAEIELELEVEVTFIGGGRENVSGEITRIVRNSADLTDRYPVEISVKNADRGILAGSAVKVRIPAGEEIVTSVPRLAIREQFGETYVLALVGGAAKRVIVEPSADEENSARLLVRGLEPCVVFTDRLHYPGDNEKVALSALLVESADGEQRR
ncbi:MAG: efflux RND transporter periplasmic adaptor subunit [Planctomycetes bacterium]|nr:efflux RND transporter periplasmic adaptor subunit [Planctomycetota bacterium]